jgi:two-component system chemotaxis sensor kinase CheA
MKKVYDEKITLVFGEDIKYNENQDVVNCCSFIGYEGNIKYLIIAQKNELDRLFTILEKNHQDKACLEAIFRITHTLKANAAGLGYVGISQMSHTLEDIFSLIKQEPNLLNQNLLNDLFRANDKLGELIQSINTQDNVTYKGLLARLNVIYKDLESTIKKTKQQENTTDKQNNNPKKNNTFNATNNSEVVNVNMKKLDNLLELVGELSIESDRLNNKFGETSKTRHDFMHLQRLTSELQYSVMNVRLVQINLLFQKFHRIVRDIAQIENKEISLEIVGNDIEIDRNILQAISETLVHIVRNAISHGIEKPEERQKKGKNTEGNIQIKAVSDKDFIIIEISDDGKGLDSEKIKQKAIEKNFLSEEQAQKINENELFELIFESGFSSMDNISEISGRGVGMDVVKRSIENIGGKINFSTQKDKGTTFKLRLPMSMAVKPVLLFLCNKVIYSLALSQIEMVFALKKEKIQDLGNGKAFWHEDKLVPLVFLEELFQTTKTTQINYYQAQNETEKQEILSVIMISNGKNMTGLVVEKLLQQKEIIEKPLPTIIQNMPYLTGTFILGNGEVGLGLNITDIWQKNHKQIQ